MTQSTVIEAARLHFKHKVVAMHASVRTAYKRMCEDKPYTHWLDTANSQYEELIMGWEGWFFEARSEHGYRNPVNSAVKVILAWRQLPKELGDGGVLHIRPILRREADEGWLLKPGKRKPKSYTRNVRLQEEDFVMIRYASLLLGEDESDVLRRAIRGFCTPFEAPVGEAAKLMQRARDEVNAELAKRS